MQTVALIFHWQTLIWRCSDVLFLLWGLVKWEHFRITDVKAVKNLLKFKTILIRTFFVRMWFFSLEFMRHHQDQRLSLRGAEPSQPVLQRASQNEAAETENAEFVHHHHQNVLSGKRAWHRRPLRFLLWESWPCVSVLSVGPGVFLRRLRGHRHGTHQPLLCRGPTSASARRREMSNNNNNTGPRTLTPIFT